MTVVRHPMAGRVGGRRSRFGEGTGARRSPLWNPWPGDAVEADTGFRVYYRGVSRTDDLNGIVCYHTASGTAERSCTIEDWRRWCAEMRAVVVEWGAR